MAISILLIGAGGTFGHPLLLEIIRQKSSFAKIGILASSPTRAEAFKWAEKSGVKIITGSYLDAKSYEGFTHVISAVGNALMSSQSQMIDAAVAAGVTHFYPSEWNSDISNPAIASMAYFRAKQATRAHLTAVSKSHPEFRYTLMVTGIFTEWSFLEFYGFDHEKGVVEAYGTPGAQVGVTSIPDIAHYTVSSLLLPSGSGERTIRVQGDRTSFQELVDALDKAKGMKYTVNYHPIAEAKKIEEDKRLEGDENDDIMWSIRPLVASGFGVADGVEGSKLDNGLFDFVPETLVETFERLFGQGN